MLQDTQETIRGLVARVGGAPLEEYLASGQFFRFCHAHGLDDVWKEYLELSRDVPELYGGAVLKNAFILFLHHTFHTRHQEFPALFARLMMDFCRWSTCELPVDDIRKDLVQLGYPDREITREFSSGRVDGKDMTESRDDRCRE